MNMVRSLLSMCCCWSFVSAVAVSLIGALATMLAAGAMRVRTRFAYGIGPRLGRNNPEPRVELRVLPLWCWARILEAPRGKAFVLRVIGVAAMVLVPFAILVASVMVRGGERPLNGPPMRVGTVHEGFPAEDAGMRVGDVIVDVEGRPTRDLWALRRALRGRGGLATRITIERRGVRRSIEVVPLPEVSDPDAARIGVQPPTRHETPGTGQAIVGSALGVTRVWRNIADVLVPRSGTPLLAPTGGFWGAPPGELWGAPPGELLLYIALFFAAMAPLWALIASIVHLVAAIVRALRRQPA